MSSIQGEDQQRRRTADSFSLERSEIFGDPASMKVNNTSERLTKHESSESQHHERGRKRERSIEATLIARIIVNLIFDGIISATPSLSVTRTRDQRRAPAYGSIDQTTPSESFERTFVHFQGLEKREIGDVTRIRYVVCDEKIAPIESPLFRRRFDQPRPSTIRSI